MKEQKVVINGLAIKYLFKERKYDTKHLVVVFSGFGGQSEFTYDFRNAFQELRANVLWIRDDFFGHCCYYLAHKNNFRIEDAVIQFIHQIMHELNISKNEVSILGASKGGSAALYYGVKYGFPNIISSVPQILIGDYVNHNWPHIAEHMAGSGSIEKFDACIIDEIERDQNTHRNIYLITSEVDIQYKRHIEPYIKYFYKYSNFNALFSESILVREHNQITGHHTDIIMGIISMLSANIAPIIGMKTLYGDQEISKEEKQEVIVEVKNARVEAQHLFLDGIGIVRGKEAKEYSQINYRLVLISDTEYVINMAKAHRPYLTKQFYNGNLYIYDKCWFTSYQYKGINISNIPKGKYNLFLEIVFENYYTREALRYYDDIKNTGNISLQVESKQLQLVIR